MQSSATLSPGCSSDSKIFMGKNCVLCLVELHGKNDNKSNLFELCRKYLHTGLTQEFSRNLFEHSCAFCQNCSESAMKLTDLSIQLESIQKSVSDLVIMFTLDILHRRGKVIDGEDKIENHLGYSKKKLIAFDVSALPDAHFFGENECISMSSESASQEIISGTVHGVQIPDSLFMHGLTDYDSIVSHFVNEEEVTCDNCEQDWMGETSLAEQEINTTSTFQIQNGINETGLVQQEINTTFPVHNGMTERGLVQQETNPTFQIQDRVNETGLVQQEIITTPTFQIQDSMNVTCLVQQETIPTFQIQNGMNETSLVEQDINTTSKFQIQNKMGETGLVRKKTNNIFQIQNRMGETGLVKKKNNNTFQIQNKELNLFGNGDVSISVREVVVENNKCDSDKDQKMRLNKVPLRTYRSARKLREKFENSKVQSKPDENPIPTEFPTTQISTASTLSIGGEETVASFSQIHKPEENPIPTEFPTTQMSTATTLLIGREETSYSQIQEVSPDEVPMATAEDDIDYEKSLFPLMFPSFQTNLIGKAFTCDVCGKDFKSRIYLLRHKTIHTGELPYKCDFCQKGFRDRSNMSKHIMLHTGEKPFRCDQCNYASAYYSNLKSHKVNRHSYIPT